MAKTAASPTKSPAASSKSKTASSSATAAASSSAAAAPKKKIVKKIAKRVDASALSAVIKRVNSGLGATLDNKKIGNIGLKGISEQVSRMLARDYGVENSKTIASAYVVMAEASLLTDKEKMRQMGLSPLSEAQMGTLEVYQDLLDNKTSAHEAVAALAALMDKKDSASQLPSHFTVALLAWMTTVACREARVKPGRISRVPGGGYNAGALSAAEKRLRARTFHLLAKGMLTSGRRLGKDEKACKSLLSTLAEISSKI